MCLLSDCLGVVTCLLELCSLTEMHDAGIAMMVVKFLPRSLQSSNDNPPDECRLGSNFVILCLDYLRAVLSNSTEAGDTTGGKQLILFS